MRFPGGSSKQTGDGKKPDRSDHIGSGEIDRQVGDLLRSKQSLYALDEKLFKDSEPDIILTQGLCDVCALDYNDVVQAARSLARDPCIVSLDPHCLDDILNDVLRIGEATHRSRQAESLVQELKVRIRSGTRSNGAVSFTTTSGLFGMV